jgi:hypothetical protein
MLIEEAYLKCYLSRVTKRVIDNVYLRTITLRGNLKTYRGAT